MAQSSPNRTEQAGTPIPAFSFCAFAKLTVGEPYIWILSHNLRFKGDDRLRRQARDHRELHTKYEILRFALSHVSCIFDSEISLA